MIPNFDLMNLMDKYGSDKGSKSNGHMYTRIYESFFSVLRKDPLILVELGLCGSAYDHRRELCAINHGGCPPLKVEAIPSLSAWREYFPNARLYGLDYDDFSAISLPNCQIIQGNVGKPTDLQWLVQIIGQPIDIIIDDASHFSKHQQIAFAELFPYLREGGLYFIEDLHYQPPDLEEEEVYPKTRDLLREFSSTQSWDSPSCSPTQQQYIQERIASISLFDTWSNDEDGENALGVIRKKWNWL